jgi:hypothetical protein
MMDLPESDLSEFMLEFESLRSRLRWGWMKSESRSEWEEGVCGDWGSGDEVGATPFPLLWSLTTTDGMRGRSFWNEYDDGEAAAAVVEGDDTVVMRVKLCAFWQCVREG